MYQYYIHDVFVILLIHPTPFWGFLGPPMSKNKHSLLNNITWKPKEIIHKRTNIILLNQVLDNTCRTSNHCMESEQRCLNIIN